MKNGRYGPYVQRGEGKEAKRSGIPQGTDPANVDFELALKLLALPREVGKHPETGEPITANFGRFGPYVAHNGQYASLESPDDVFTIGINHAVTVLAEKKAKSRPRGGPEALKELGNNAEGNMVKLMRGRYGPYVTDGSTNATMPKDSDPLTLTLDQANVLIAEREAAGGGKKKPKRAKAKPAAKEKAAKAAKAKAAPAPKSAKAKPAKAKAVKAKKAPASKSEPEEVEG
jgi:DNA topoisomerase-1